MSITNLPTHCVEHLIQFLSKRDVYMFSEAFPQHREATDLYWKKLRVVKYEEMAFDDIESLQRNINLCTNVQELTMTSFARKNREEALFLTDLSFLTAVAEICCSLKYFEVDHGNDDILGKLFSKNQQLEDVTLKTYITGSCIRHLSRNLSSLNLKYEINGDILLQCLQGWNLETLTIPHFSKIQNFFVLLVAAAPKLQHLSTNCDYTDVRNLESLQSLKELISLRLLGLRNNHNLELNNIFVNCVNLELLEIRGYQLHLNQAVFESIAALPKLKEILLHCTDDGHISDYKSVMRWLSRSQSLTSLNLYFCRFFTNEEILMLINGSYILTNLVLPVRRELLSVLLADIEELLETQESRRNGSNLTFNNHLFSPKMRTVASSSLS